MEMFKEEKGGWREEHKSITKLTGPGGKVREAEQLEIRKKGAGDRFCTERCSF